MATAPQAIWQCHYTLLAHPHRPASYAMDGIVGDAAHMDPPLGYHLSADDLRAHGAGGDYSLTLARDAAGARANPGMASAWDLGFSPDDMRLVTGRLLAAAKANDARLHGWREFCGTTDSVHTHPYDLSNGQDGPLDSWDDSHLHHVHVSAYRDACTNYAALLGVVDVICGVEPDPPFTPGGGMLVRFTGADVKNKNAVYQIDQAGMTMLLVTRTNGSPALQAKQRYLKSQKLDYAVHVSNNPRYYYGVPLNFDPTKE